MPTPFDFVPETAVSLIPSMTESMFHLGMGDRLLAITDFCIKPEGEVDGLPRIGGTKNPDIERIIELNPDLVLMNSEENRKADQEKLEAAGIATWVTEPRTVRESINVLWDLMDIFEMPDRSEAVRQIERAYDFTELAMRGEEIEPIAVFVPIWKDPWMTFNRDTYIHDLLSIVGAQNVFEERERLIPLRADLGEAEPRESDADKRYPRVTLEEVEAHQPEVVLLPSEPYVFSEADADTFYELDIPAAKNKHIYTVDGTLLTWHGTRVGFALQELPPLFDQIRKSKT